MSPENFSITVIRSDRKTLSVQIKDCQVIARAPLKMKEKDIYDFINSKRDWIEKHLVKQQMQKKTLEEIKPFTERELKALAEGAKQIIADRVSYYAPRVGVTCNRITIRSQRTRWGSCSSKGNLNFNCLLALFPIEVIDSVVVHELCHRKHMNHSPAFYAEVERVYPQYHKHHKWLKDNGSAYMARLPK